MKVPKLRFKEFSGEWEEKRLGDIADISSGLTPLRSEIKYYENPTIPWIKTTDLNNSYIETTEEKINEITLKETSLKLLPKNTLLIAMYGGFNQIGRTGLTTVESTTNQALSAIKFNNKNISSLFFLNLFNCKVNLWKKVAGSSRKDPNITKKDIEEFKIYYPECQEQEKIGNFLSSIDKKISLTEEKLNLFKSYKKGMMQKIFKQEIRFKDENGQDYPDWVEKRLGDIATFSKGKALSKEDLSDTGIECIRYGELYTHYTEVIDKIQSKTNLNKDELVLSEENDIIIPSSGETALDIAKASCVLKSGVALGGDLNIIKVKESGVFLSYYLNNKLKKDIASLAQGASIIHLYENHLKLLKINLPCLEEQEKIAKFLSSIDNKIENLSTELENLKDFKKGLLQKMFI